MWNIICVGMGAFAGSVLRYLVSGWIQKLPDTPFFPYGTLGVNVLRCLAIGLLGGWADNAELVDDAIVEGIATREDVEIHFYRTGRSGS